jgi:hypothetical protein
LREPYLTREPHFSHLTFNLHPISSHRFRRDLSFLVIITIFLLRSVLLCT